MVIEVPVQEPQLFSSSYIRVTNMTSPCQIWWSLHDIYRSKLTAEVDHSYNYRTCWMGDTWRMLETDCMFWLRLWSVIQPPHRLPGYPGLGFRSWYNIGLCESSSVIVSPLRNLSPNSVKTSLLGGNFGNRATSVILTFAYDNFR